MTSIRVSLFALILLFCTAYKSHDSSIKPAVGELAPEIILRNPDGKVIKLSDLRGQVVLIDFWASWCRTCRVENNTIRQAYDIYKHKKFNIGEGFTVYSISLDTDEGAWQKAIKNDRLSWENHGCEFKKWESAIVKSYNFSYLPQNLLIDSTGKILYKGLFGNKLAETLASHLAE